MTDSTESLSKEARTAVITDQERDLAQRALSAFEEQNYANCLWNLNKLEQLRPKDLKVMHNKVIVEYFKSELKKTELARKSLNAICGAPTSVESQTDDADDVEKCVMRYNQAVLLYHTRQFEAALHILNKLFAFIEPMEESLARKVCLLMIELHIVTNRFDSALALVNYVESQFICATDSAKLTSSPSTSSAAGEKETAPKAITMKESKDKKKENVDLKSKLFRFRLLKYKARLYLLLQQPKLCKKEWKLLVSLGVPTNTTMTFLKAHLEYVRGNYAKSQKLLNFVSNNIEYKPSGISAAVVYYNNVACINFAQGKPILAAFYLQKALEENKQAIESVRVKDTDPLSSQPLYTLGGDKHHELMFSLGISLLHAGQATRAFDCLTEAAQRMHNNPVLWLKLAECCIHCHKPSNDVDFDMARRRQDMVQQVVGSGKHRKIILCSALNKDSRYHVESLSYAIPQPTLEFAMLCLKNALYTLPKEESPPTTINTSTASTSAVTTSVSSGIQSSMGSLSSQGNILGNHTPTSPAAPATSEITEIESSNLKIAILGASAYVSLCMGDYVLALQYSKSLLEIENIPGAYKMLGNLYAAESLILMDKINEAIGHLKLQNLEDLNTSIPVPESMLDGEKTDVGVVNAKKWFPTTVTTAKAVLRYNLAVAYTIRGELDKASEILKQIWISRGPDCDVPIHVIMLALYIELQKGHIDVARSIVKLHCPQYWS